MGVGSQSVEGLEVGHFLHYELAWTFISLSLCIFSEKPTQGKRQKQNQSLMLSNVMPDSFSLFFCLHLIFKSHSCGSIIFPYKLHKVTEGQGR